jgi:putative CocE/NonD family hydrolase
VTVGQTVAGMQLVEAMIPMADGVRLAATLYMPPDLSEDLPVVLEYLPYRKDDGMLERDLGLYPYLVSGGYVGARVDIRGTGRSEGRLPEGEYSEREQLDGLEVIAWLAAQSWSNGNVGMWGISWGGFNSIQLALRKPPALGAIIAVDASDDLFHDDIHYIDGIMHIDEYELGIDVWNAMSPAPTFPLDEETLGKRFDTEPWLLSWLRHQRQGPYWKRGSLRPDYQRLQVPALLVAGWLDGYRDSVARMLTYVPAPTRAIVGPWNHAWPHSASPGPEIEWRAEAVRWWDHWLKGRDTGILEEPRLAVFVRDAHPPDPKLETVPGTWRLEDWPVERTDPRQYHLRPDGSLSEDRGGRGVHRVAYVPSAGAEAGPWWGELTIDQRPLDRTCLVYESEPLDRHVEILGVPVATIDASFDAPLAHLFVRLSDVQPDGAVALVTGGGRNGAHRRSPEHPVALALGEVDRFDIPLRFTSWEFPAGHRIRIAISNHLWPMMWPTPQRMTMSLHLGESHIILPVIPHADRPVPSWDPPQRGPAVDGIGSRGEILPVVWDARRDGSRATAGFEGRSEAWFPWGRETFMERLIFEVDDERPELASCRGVAENRAILPGRELAWRGDLEIRSDAEIFHYRYRRSLQENGRTIRERVWSEPIPRDHQ